MHSELKLKDDARHPWTVIVREGCVFRRYRTDTTPSELRDDLATDLCSGDLDVYDVSAEQDPPPEEGQPVDPVALGWTSRSNKTCRPDRDDDR
ncbi:MAG TPA: hypothetical protein VHX44_03115 [Planctomycetota bacterium]|nr:hypothetical protein [Planctomycetota bacterium]